MRKESLRHRGNSLIFYVSLAIIFFLLAVTLISTFNKNFSQNKTLVTKASGGCTYQYSFVYCSAKQCQYKCEITYNGIIVSEYCLDNLTYPSEHSCAPGITEKYETYGDRWICDNNIASKEFCGVSKGTNNSTPQCSISGVPASQLSGSKINFSIKVGGSSPVAAEAGYPQTSGGRCTGVVGDFSGNLLTNNPRSGYYTLRASGGLCTLTMNAKDAAGNVISCNASTAVQCNPVRLNESIGYTTQNGLALGSICNGSNPALTQSKGSYENSASPLKIPALYNGIPVKALCVKGEVSPLSTQVGNITYVFNGTSDSNSTWKTVSSTAKESTWYAIPLSKITSTTSNKFLMGAGWAGASINYVSYCHATDTKPAYFKK